MKQRKIRNVHGLICPNPKPPHGEVVGWVSSVNPVSTRVYRPRQFVDSQVSLIKCEITGCQVSHLKFLLCKPVAVRSLPWLAVWQIMWQGKARASKQKLKVARLP